MKRGLIIAIAAATAFVAGCAHKNAEMNNNAVSAADMHEAGYQNAKDRVSCKHKPAKKRHKKVKKAQAATAEKQQANNEQQQPGSEQQATQ